MSSWTRSRSAQISPTPGRRPNWPSWAHRAPSRSSTDASLVDSPDPVSRRAELVEEYTERYANPYVAAERGYVDAVIDPADTRAMLVRAFRLLASKREDLPKRKHGNVPL